MYMNTCISFSAEAFGRELLAGPQNTVFVLGSDYHPLFNCTFEEQNGIDQQWAECANPNDNIPLLLATDAVPVVQGVEIKGEYNLAIINPDMDDGGAYLCLVTSFRRNQAQADLIIIGEYGYQSGQVHVHVHVYESLILDCM